MQIYSDVFKTRLLFIGKLYVPLTSLLLTVIAYGVYNSETIIADEAWLLLNSFINTIRLFHIYRVEKIINDQKFSQKESHKHELIYGFFALLVGTSWGGVLYVFDEIVNTRELLSLVVFAFGVLTGGVFSQYPSKSIAYLFTVSIVATFVSYFLINWEPGSLLVIIGGVLFANFLFKAIKLANQSLDQLFDLQKQQEMYIQELTKRVELEQQLRIERESHSKRVKLATIGEAAGNISHEINNPLSIIYGYAGLAQKKLKEHDQILSVNEDLTKIRSTVLRIKKVVDSMLRISRSEKNSLKYFVIDQCLEDITGLFFEKFKSYGIQLKLQNEAIDKNIYAEESMLSQVLVNLIGNATDAIRESGVGSEILIKTQSDNLIYRIQVIDNGPGILDEHKLKIFEAFFTTKSSGKGTGLGLSLSKELVENMGGELLLKEGSPTCFEIVLHKNKWPELMGQVS
jgi:signal transduction histidine kinase